LIPVVLVAEWTLLKVLCEFAVDSWYCHKHVYRVFDAQQSLPNLRWRKPTVNHFAFSTVPQSGIENANNSMNVVQGEKVQDPIIRRPLPRFTKAIELSL